MQHFADLVKAARSYRRFNQADPIPEPLVRSLLDTARFAPSGGNQQPLRYRLVTTPDLCAAVFENLKWAAALKDWAGPQPGQRPTAYILILAEKGKNVATDLGIAAQTLQLAATAAGYAACMLGNINRPALTAALNLPPAYDLHLVLALGRPAETIILEDLPPNANPAYWRTPDQAHHVPKRRLDDILI